MPLQNRVNPFGELCAFCARGLFMGNRGWRFHTEAKTLMRRRWASRQWICCVLEFKGRRRDVWSSSYTELFFLDEPTAFAAAAPSSNGYATPRTQCRTWSGKTRGRRLCVRSRVSWP